MLAFILGEWIEAGQQALARIVRMGDLRKVPLIEQAWGDHLRGTQLLDGLPLKAQSHGVDHGIRQHRQVGQGPVADLAALAEGVAQQARMVDLLPDLAGRRGDMDGELIGLHACETSQCKRNVNGN